MLDVWYKFFSSVLAECIIFMSLFLLHLLGYFDFFVWICFTISSDFDRLERKGQGANRPESYWLIRSGERIGPGAKRLGTIWIVQAALYRRSEFTPINSMIADRVLCLSWVLELLRLVLCDKTPFLMVAFYSMLGKAVGKFSQFRVWISSDANSLGHLWTLAGPMPALQIST